MKIISTLLLLTIYIGIYAQGCNESSLITQEIRATDTDDNIPWELAKHYTYYNPDCENRQILVLHLVGSYDNPTNNILFPSLAANNGFHAICLKYPNSTPALTACGGSSSADCFNNYRKEIIEGGDYSSDVDVDQTNSINNRFLKLLIYLETNFPDEGWGNYYNGTSIHWNKVIVSGHSQGGGHAAYIAKSHEVKRCLMFASPNDYSSFFSAPAPWVSNTSSTPQSNYFGFINLYDDVADFSQQFEIWNGIGMPNFGDSLNVDLVTNYSASHQLYTTTLGPNANDNHSLMIRDEQTPLNGFGKPIFEPVWEYMLGIDIGLNLNELKPTDFSIYPNPASELITIQSNEIIKQPCTVTIFNLYGQIIIAENIVNQTYQINIELLPKGLYILKIESGTEIISLTKFNKID